MKNQPTREPLFNLILMLLLLVSALFSPLVFGAELVSVRFEGEANAVTAFDLSAGEVSEPKMDIRDSFVTLTFNGVTLAKSFEGKAEFKTPHFLIEKLVVYSPYAGMLRAQFILNGSNAGLSDRVRLTRVRTGYTLTLDPPKAGQATLDLMKKENEPLVHAQPAEKKSVAASGSMTKWILAILCALGLSVGAYFFLRNMKRRMPFSGSRKYLIEQMAYSSLGPKTGVALYKVGPEFVLLGVTANQISFLSNLPRLQKDYEEENEFERNTFKKAVRDEMGRSSARPQLDT